MVGVWSSDIDNVYIWIFYELGVGTVGFGAGWGFDVFQESGGPRGRGGGCGCCDDMLDIVDIAGGGVGEEVFGECLMFVRIFQIY